MYDAPTVPYCIQVKLVGRREERMKAKVKRGTAAGNLYCGLSTLCDVTCHLKLCETIATDCVCTRFGWKEAMIQQAYNFVC